MPGDNAQPRFVGLISARLGAVVAAVVLVANLVPLAAAAAPLLVATIAVGETPVGVAVNPETNRIYVTNRMSNDVTVIDGLTDQVLATIVNNQVPQGVAVNPLKNRIYVSELGRGLTIIDGFTNPPLARLPVGAGAFTVAVNASTDRVYVPSFHDRNVSVIDGETRSVLTVLMLGGNPSAAAVNPRTNLVYVANYALGNVTIIDGASNAVIGLIATGGNPTHLAVNTTTGRLYVTGTPYLSVIDTTTNAVIAQLDLGSADEVVVNEALNRAYVTSIGVNTLSVVDGFTNTRISTVSLGSFPAGLSVNPLTNRVYVAKFFDRAVAVYTDPDVSPPTITSSVSPEPNMSGWNNEDVTVRWTVADPLGIATSTGCEEATVTGDTPGETITCSATNTAGGTASRSVQVKLDKTPPTVEIDASTSDGSAYVAGTWTNQNVIVHRACSDALSGIVAGFCGDVIHTIETASGSSSGTATDAAGNTTTVTFGPIRIDKTPPSIRGTGTTSDGRPYIPGTWTNQTVTVRFTCGDFWSGVAGCTGPQELSAPELTTVVNGTAIDNAGNRRDSPFGPVLIDKVAPTVDAVATTADGSRYVAATWTNQPVTVRFVCSDAFSGISDCTPDTTFSAEGPVDGTTGAATDRANNRTITSFGPIFIDRTAPTIAFSGNAGTYTVDETVLVTCVAEDSLSGVASTTCPAVAFAPATDFVGSTASTTTELSATAQDGAGNVAIGTTSITVLVTADGICDLVASHNDGAICALVRAVADAKTSTAKAHQLDALDAYLRAQADKSITSDLTALLSRLTRLL